MLLGSKVSKEKMNKNANGDPCGKTCFGPVNSGSSGAAFHHEGRFLAWGGGLYATVKASSNLRLETSPLQYFL